MMHARKMLLALVPAMLLGTLTPSEAQACSCFFACRNAVIVDERLAAGAEGFYWFLAGGGVQPGDIPEGALKLELQGEDGSWVEVEHELKYSHPAGTVHIVRPKDGFVIDASYRFTADLSGWDSGCSVEIEQGMIEPVATATTTIASVTPGAMLTAEVSDLVQEPIEFESDAACSEPFDAAYRDVTIKLPPSLEGMERSLFFQVEVDGEPYIHESNSCYFIDIEPGAMDQARNVARLAALCESAPDYAANGSLAPGMHEVVVSASLPESDLFKWTSAPVMIDLECPGGSSSDMGSGQPDMGSGQEPDLGGGPGGPGDPDLGGSGEPDMGSSGGGDMSAGGPDQGEEEEPTEDTSGGDDARCAQSAPAAPARGALGGALILGLVGLMRRRRPGKRI